MSNGSTDHLISRAVSRVQLFRDDSNGIDRTRVLVAL